MIYFLFVFQFPKGSVEEKAREKIKENRFSVESWNILTKEAQVKTKQKTLNYLFTFRLISIYIKGKECRRNKRLFWRARQSIHKLQSLLENLHWTRNKIKVLRKCSTIVWTLSGSCTSHWSLEILFKLF